jgi:hypothetical protein
VLLTSLRLSIHPHQLFQPLQTLACASRNASFSRRCHDGSPLALPSPLFPPTSLLNTCLLVNHICPPCLLRLLLFTSKSVAMSFPRVKPPAGVSGKGRPCALSAKRTQRPLNTSYFAARMLNWKQSVPLFTISFLGHPPLLWMVSSHICLHCIPLPLPPLLHFVAL